MFATRLSKRKDEMREQMFFCDGTVDKKWLCPKWEVPEAQKGRDTKHRLLTTIALKDGDDGGVYLCATTVTEVVSANCR